MSHRVLLLNAWYFPHAVIPWQAAIKLVYEGNVDVLAEYSETVRSPSVEWKMPAVVRLKRTHKNQRHLKSIKLSRMNVYLRDDFRCQYCGGRFKWGELSYDHVVPRAHGGQTTWRNVVTACRPCNAKKGKLSCDDAGMFPLRAPEKPSSLPQTRLLIDPAWAPAEWLPFLQS